MKQFKDYTLEDFANPELFTYTSIEDQARPKKRVAHCGLLRLVNKGANSAPRTNHRIGELTEELLAVPTVTRPR